MGWALICGGVGLLCGLAGYMLHSYKKRHEEEDWVEHLREELNNDSEKDNG